ncbi:MAG: CRISPR-associated protein Cas4 [Proteobacteria bacterium]|nr:CRISPR-associated protein Cas4 [Pseudomonadota bacterium]
MTEGCDQQGFSQDDLIPVSSVADLVYCERRAALHFLEGTWEENQFTAEGHILHEKTHEADYEMRKDIRIVRGLRLRSLKLGLSGVADVVEFRRLNTSLPKDKSNSDMPPGVALSGINGFWEPFPVEYKRGKLKHEKSYEIQLCAQALCIEEMLHVRVIGGAIFYGKSMRRHDVIFTEGLRQETEAAAKRMHNLIDSGQTPKPVYGKKCDSCSLVDECLPKTIAKHKSVRRYLSVVMKET